MVAWLWGLAKTLVGQIQPGCCGLCLLPLATTEVHFCRVCLADLPRFPPHSIRNWAPSEERTDACRFWFCALPWHSSARYLIQQFKFSQQPELARILAPLLAAHVTRCYQQHAQPLPDYIVAMPQTARRWRQRGYNQAGLLAANLTNLLPVSYWPGLLRRLQHMPEQHKSSAQQRWQNLQTGVHCTAQLKGETIAVIDDVLTTGASVTAVAKALRRRGAAKVDAWTFAYTLPPQRD
ncbi:MAG: phosphoribosyltransferase family protein [Idiomarina sp.]